MNDFDTAVRGQWSGKAAAFERSFAALCGYPAGSLLDAVGPIEGKRLLDVGTGTGTVAALAAQRGALTVGVDPDPEMLEVARAKAKTAIFGVDALPGLHWKSEAFDAAVANFVVNHVGDPRAALVELARVVKPGGGVAVTIWPAPKSPALGLPEQMLAECGVSTAPPTRLPEHLDFSRDEDGLAGLLLQAGLVDVRVARIDWTFRTTFDDYWAGQLSGITGAGEIIATQSPAMVAHLKATLAVLVGLFRNGNDLALPAQALLATGRRPLATTGTS